MVGAGPTGAHTAGRLARGGLRVALIDRREAGRSGAQWVNGVAGWMFDAAGVTPPRPPELLGHGHPFIMLSPSGQNRVEAAQNPICEVDMRHLGQRLVADAERAGVELFWDTEVRQVTLNQTGRPTAIKARAPKQARWTFKAKVFVDASGLAAVLRRQIPALDSACPEPDPQDLCSASQHVFDVIDKTAARGWLTAKGGEAGQTLAWTGLHGGYSILNVRLDDDLESVSVLTGAITAEGASSGQRILRDFVSSQSWIGEARFGGSRALPLRRPYTRLAAPGAALVGDSACQIFSAHGSGVGIGLIAARELSDAVLEAAARGEDPGALASLWEYSARFHRKWGGLLASSDLFRRFSQTLGPDDLEAMMASGLMTPTMVADGLAQKDPKVPAGEWPRVLLALMKAPKVAVRMLPVLVRMPLVRATARTYPSKDRAHTDVALFRYEAWMRALVERESRQ